MNRKALTDKPLRLPNYLFFQLVMSTGAIAVFIIVAVFPTTSYGTTVEEEELIERDVVFSIPLKIAQNQRQTAIDSGFCFLTGASIFGGTDDNSYRSPAELTQSSEPWGYWLYVRSDMRFSKMSRLLSTANWKSIDYPGQSNINYRRGYLSNWLSVRLRNRVEVILDFDFSIKNDDATKITGESYTRDYSYSRYESEAVIIWHISDVHRAYLGGELIQKDYGEREGLNSIDWSSRFLTFRYRYRIGAYHYIRIRYSFGDRGYRDEPASLRDGTELPGNPDEKHRYHEVMIGYVAPVAEWLDISFQYEYRTKRDLFEGYESWDSHGFDIWAGVHLSRRFELSMGLGFLDHNYRNLLGDDGQPLEYTKWQSEVGLRYEISGPLWIFGNMNYYNRDTNLSSGNSYRDYRGVTTLAGVSVFFIGY